MYAFSLVIDGPQNVSTLHGDRSLDEALGRFFGWRLNLSLLVINFKTFFTFSTVFRSYEGLKTSVFNLDCSFSMTWTAWSKFLLLVDSLKNCNAWAGVI